MDEHLTKKKAAGKRSRKRCEIERRGEELEELDEMGLNGWPCCVLQADFRTDYLLAH